MFSDEPGRRFRSRLSRGILGAGIAIQVTLAAAVAAPGAGPLRVYVATLSESSVTIAWGRISKGSENTIGYSATNAPAKVRIAGRKYEADRNWLSVENLAPDTDYPYSVELAGGISASGTVRTWPARSGNLTFFVIGDWGNGKVRQRAIARRMEEERQRLAAGGETVRFVLSTGDNIYAGGAFDSDWDRKFFAPYGATLAAIPFYAVPGNHDGNESESAADLPAYLDNFFFPTGKPARWYTFRYAGLAEFFALDSTRNQWPGPPSPAYREDGEQSEWLRTVLRGPALPWRIAVVHHPLFTAGPDHGAALPALRHWFQEWRDGGVAVIFSGHEHNLQFAERSEATGGMQFVVSGAGGQLRGGNVRAAMKKAHISAWAPRTHFLVVEISRDLMRITPVGDGPIEMQDSAGRPIALPFVVPRRPPAAADRGDYR